MLTSLARVGRSSGSGVPCRRPSRGGARLTWQPERYLAFADQRTRPALDLLARVPLANPARVADLGCGPGNSTALLAQRWPEAAVIGVDSSPEMLAQARASGVRATWIEADIGAWTPDRPARSDLCQRGAAVAGRSRDAVAEVARPAARGRRARGADAAQLRGALARPVARDRPQRAVGGSSRRNPGAATGGRARVVSRPAGAARGGAGHLGDGVPARAGGRRPGAELDPRNGASPGHAGAGRGAVRRVRNRLRGPSARGLSQAPRRPHAVPLPAPVHRRPAVA